MENQLQFYHLLRWRKVFTGALASCINLFIGPLYEIGNLFLLLSVQV